MLDNLPFELLTLIYSNLPTAQSVRDLSLTCQYLNDYTSKEGWKVFLQHRFPSVPRPPSKQDDQATLEAAHSLTTLSRNWDRRAFVARYLEPSGSIFDLRSGKAITRWERPRGQTMGYQPCIDSHEEWIGGSWTSRKQVLAWGAGTDIVLRVKRMGTDSGRLWEESEPADKRYLFDEHKHQISWLTWKVPESTEGRDDITALQLLKPHQKAVSGTGEESVVYGTANGDLSILRIRDPDARLVTQTYETSGRSISSIGISPSKNPILAASAFSLDLMLYPIAPELEMGRTHVQPLSKITMSAGTTAQCRIWSTNFISDERLAIGLGAVADPIRIHELTSTGLTAEPIRSFRTHGNGNSTIYPIIPLPADSQVGHNPGQVFLSGCYDGSIRLHDMRSPSDSESTYWDPTNDSAIYSLQTLGRERLVAGASQHSMLKVFDLRVSGGRAYHYLGTPLPPPKEPKADMTRPSLPVYSGWNIFLNPRNVAYSNNRANVSSHGRTYTRSASSPVYSLSLPSPSSPSLFAGVEDAVFQLDFTSILDKHPDPVFAPAIERIPKTGEIDVKRTWNSKGEVLNMGMYEQLSEEGNVGMKLLVQASVGNYKGRVKGLDERWRHPGEEDDSSRGSGGRWERGRGPRGRGRGAWRAWMNAG